MVIIDPLGAVVKLIGVWKESKQAQAWARLLGSMLFSGLIAFLSSTGAALVAGNGLLVGLGYGLLAAATSLFALFVASPLTRGMMISVPRGAVERFQQNDDQVKITRQ